MIDSPTSRRPSSSEQPRDEFELLRRLLLGPEQAGVARLQERLDNPDRRAHDLGLVLSKAVRVSVKTDSAALAGALFPVMGPSIRKAVYAVVREMVESLEIILERSFSYRCWRWRWEAWRTGRSFAEVALIRSLVYRVEQVFLIHRQTGLVLQHVAAQLVAKDPDLVAGMLAAIQDFVQHSFEPRDGTLHTMQVGEYRLWIEHGPEAVLACVIRGTPPPHLRTKLHTVIERIHLEYSNEVQTFDGDPQPFEACKHHLEECLEQQLTVDGRSRTRFVWLLAAVVLIPLTVWAALAVREQSRWSAFLTDLRAEPGIAVTFVGKKSGRFAVVGLRDALGADPLDLLQAHHLRPDQVDFRWEPYRSLAPPIVMTRTKPVIERIEAVRLRFHVSTTQLLPGQEWQLSVLTADIRNLAEALPPIGKDLRIEIVGLASPEGTEEENTQLRHNRARTMRDLLIAGGLPEKLFRSAGGDSKQWLRPELSEEDRAANRSVCLRVNLTDTPPAGSQRR